MDKPTKVVGRRVAAFLIDLVILSIFNSLVFLLFADKQSDIVRGVLTGTIQADETAFVNLKLGDEEYSIVGGGKFFAYFSIITLAGFLYYAVLQGIKGWTPGKLALGIRVVNDQGRTGPGIGKATVRWLLWIVDSFPWLIPYLVGFVSSLATDKNQRVGDMVAKTFVVRRGDVGRVPFGQPAFGVGYGQPQFGGPPQAQQPQQAAAGGGAGWHPDPHGQARLRYWDGSQWTEHTSP